MLHFVRLEAGTRVLQCNILRTDSFDEVAFFVACLMLLLEVAGISIRGARRGRVVHSHSQSL